MPLCEITIGQGFLSKRSEERLISSIAGHLLEAEGLATGDITREMCSFAIDGRRPLFSGNGKRQRRKTIVKVHYLDGAISEMAKAKLIRDVTHAIKGVCKTVEDRDIWCLLIPIQKGCFGVAGNPVSLELIQSIASAEE